MNVKKFKNDNNEKYIFKLNFITLKDYGELDSYEAMEFDKRPFYVLFFKMLKEDHTFFNLMFVDSILDPLWLRLFLFYLGLSIMFTLNAFFFSDDYIDARASIPSSDAVIFIKNLFKNFKIHVEFNVFYNGQ